MIAILVSMLVLSRAADAAPQTASMPAPGPAVTVRTVEGDTLAGRLSRLDERGALLDTAGGPVSIKLGELEEIALGTEPRDALAAPGQAIVRTVDGQLLAAEQVLAAEGQFIVITPAAGTLWLPADRVRAVVLPDRTVTPAAVETAAAEPLAARGDGNADRLVARGPGGDLMVLPGRLNGISADRIAFHYRRQDRTVERAKVAMIVMSDAAKIDPPPGQLILQDGSRLGFDAIRLHAGHFTLTSGAAEATGIPAERATAVLYRPAGVTYLSELTPAEVHEAGTFDTVFTWRADRSSGAGPLRLAGRTWPRGLGLHSRCRLTYRLQGRYRRLIAVAGIDDAARPHGDATLAIAADGRELLAPTRLTGRDAPIPLRLDLAGAQTLTIEVDYGEGLDVGDSVDLGDAKLIEGE